MHFKINFILEAESKWPMKKNGIIFNKWWVLTLIFKILFISMNYPTSNTQDLFQQNQNCYEEIVSYKLYRSLGHGESLWFFFIKGYEMHFRLMGYWLEKLVYLAGYRWNGSHLDYSSNLLTSFLASALPSYRLFNTGLNGFF